MTSKTTRKIYNILANERHLFSRYTLLYLVSGPIRSVDDGLSREYQISLSCIGEKGTEEAGLEVARNTTGEMYRILSLDMENISFLFPVIQFRIAKGTGSTGLPSRPRYQATMTLK
jgi:hypothetical protein